MLQSSQSSYILHTFDNIRKSELFVFYIQLTTLQSILAVSDVGSDRMLKQIQYQFTIVLPSNKLSALMQ